ncbi:MAG TPA: DEAD/DEAH box helicase [Burkholderiaceae bacterium]|nr:DEAD/DEAH box helicase [Burkholderiaceae bacterium]
MSLTLGFAGLGLTPALVRAVADEGYTQPTPIQAQAIPVILAGRDVLAAAQTGTGKTAGFTLPLLQLLSAGQRPRPQPKTVRALILTPTRELAAQVQESVRTYGAHSKLSSTLVYGGVNINPQIGALKRGIDILVATPGRLLDHCGQRTVDLSQVEILVLDEADRMLDMGFIHDIKRVLKLLPAQRQNLLFSATFSDEIRELAHGLLRSPVTVEVARRNAPTELVTQIVYPVAKENKRELLRDLIVDGDWRQVLVFTRTKHGANRLAEQLGKDGLCADAIHGNKSQNARTRALAGFKDASVRVLVATDIAARGLDIEQLPHVVNYELPNVPEDYVHRIGRTGRAGSPGHAVSLVGPDESGLLRDIERLLKRTLPRGETPARLAGAPKRPAESAPAVRPERPGPRDGRRQPTEHEKHGRHGLERGRSHQAGNDGNARKKPARPSVTPGTAKAMTAGAAPAVAPATTKNATPRSGERRHEANGRGSGENMTGVRSNLPRGWPVAGNRSR